MTAKKLNIAARLRKLAETYERNQEQIERLTGEQINIEQAIHDMGDQAPAPTPKTPLKGIQSDVLDVVAAYGTDTTVENIAHILFRESTPEQMKAVAHACSRLAKQGKLVRVARGRYRAEINPPVGTDPLVEQARARRLPDGSNLPYAFVGKAETPTPNPEPNWLQTEMMMQAPASTAKPVMPTLDQPAPAGILQDQMKAEADELELDQPEAGYDDPRTFELGDENFEELCTCGHEKGGHIPALVFPGQASPPQAKCYEKGCTCLDFEPRGGDA